MLTICFVKLISILLNYKVKGNLLLSRNVRGKGTNVIYLIEKIGKNRLTLCSIKLTWILFLFRLAWNGNAATKFWLRLQFCRLLQDLQLQHYISSTLINGGNFMNNNFNLFCRSKASLGIQQRLKSRRFSTKFYLGRLRPEVQSLTLLYTTFDRKGTPSVYVLLAMVPPHMLILDLSIPLNCCKCTVFKIWINHKTRPFTQVSFTATVTASVSPFGAILPTEMTGEPWERGWSNSTFTTV